MSTKLFEILGLNAENSGTYTDHWHPVTPSIRELGHGKVSTSPIDGQKLPSVANSTENEVREVIQSSLKAFDQWRVLPAPKRGELIRQVGEEFRRHKSELAELITLEMGKPISESEGEVQEAIDICDFAVGLSRMLYGKTMHSERPQHRMYEQWHPLGPVAVITAFNFPVAVWAWNAAIAAVCGDTVIWKGSEKTPLCTIATQKICEKVFQKSGYPGVFSVVTGGADVGSLLVKDNRIPLVSATGSTEMGRKIGEATAKRFGRSLLELGGNNAIIVLRDADLELAARGIAFGAAGTTGQRCTTTRRLLVEREVSQPLIDRLKDIYSGIQVGIPLHRQNLIGPLIDERSAKSFEAAVAASLAEGGELLCGGKRLAGLPTNLYVEPTIIRAEASHQMPKKETFVPILYVIPVADLEEAIATNNSVSHGLSSAIFTNNLKSAERFLSHLGSDCGIANVNIGTSGAEIGGAFGGEKETGGGREAGSDSWKAYMRRQTCTINWSDDLPLAQGVKFDGYIKA